LESHHEIAEFIAKLRLVGVEVEEHCRRLIVRQAHRHGHGGGGDR
jgi:hypothetical protein